MTTSLTRSTTFNRSHARRVATKMAADLHRMQRLYGWPTDAVISDLIEEVTEMLAMDYVKSLEVGFGRDGKRVVTLRYEARRDGTLSGDDNAGSVPRGVDISGCEHINFMTYTRAFTDLPAAERNAFVATLPYARVTGDGPGHGAGYWQRDRVYSVNGHGTVRETFRPY